MAKMVSYLVTGKDGLMIVTYHPGSVVCLAQGKDRPWYVGWMPRPDCVRHRLLTIYTPIAAVLLVAENKVPT